jgi:hypothetical protein
VGLWSLSNQLHNFFIRCYNICLKKFFGYLKYDRNRAVYSELNIVTPGTILVNELYRIDSELCVFAESNSWAWSLVSRDRFSNEWSVSQ